jgi:hypothetical protein
MGSMYKVDCAQHIGNTYEDIVNGSLCFERVRVINKSYKIISRFGGGLASAFLG